MYKPEAIVPGMKVEILEGDKKIDEGEVFEVNDEGPHGNRQVSLVSNHFDKGQIKKFFFGDEGWLVIFPDPMTDLPCFSPNGPLYEIRPA
jgi:hypothetical protein